jgi:hypothetical protein
MPSAQGEYVHHPNFPHLPPHVPAMYAQMMNACLSQHPEDRPPLRHIQQCLAELRSQAGHPHPQVLTSAAPSLHVLLCENMAHASGITMLFLLRS